MKRQSPPCINAKSTRVASSSGVTSKGKGDTDCGSMDAFAALLPHEVVTQSQAEKALKTIEAAFKKEATARADEWIARLLYQAEIPLNIVNNIYECMVEAIGQARRNHVPLAIMP